MIGMTPEPVGSAITAEKVQAQIISTCNRCIGAISFSRQKWISGGNLIYCSRV